MFWQRVKEAHPGATPMDWERAFAKHWLGHELADQIYGGRPALAMDETLLIAVEMARIFERLEVPYFIGGSLASS